MIKKIFDKLFKNEDKLECAVDEETVDCKEFEQDYEHINDDPHDGWWLRPEYSGDYTGVPAPVVCPEDEWFTGAFGDPIPLSEKQREYQVEQQRIVEEEMQQNTSKEPDNIHELMYNIATNHGKTTVQLNPPGGSENFLDGHLGGSENRF